MLSRVTASAAVRPPARPHPRPRGGVDCSVVPLPPRAVVIDGDRCELSLSSSGSLRVAHPSGRVELVAPGRHYHRCTCRAFHRDFARCRHIPALIGAGFLPSEASWSVAGGSPREVGPCRP